MIKHSTPKLNLLKITFCCLIAFMSQALGDVRKESFYKPPRIAPLQYVALGADYHSTPTSRQRQISAGYKYKSSKLIQEIEFLNQVTYSQSSRKALSKSRQLYDFEFSNKVAITNHNNYINYYNRSRYDKFSKFYYDIINAFGLGKNLLEEKIELDFNLGYNYGKNSRNGILLNPNLKVTIPLGKNLKFSAKGYIFAGKEYYNEQLKSNLSLRLDKNLQLELLHSYEKERYVKKKERINNISRYYILRLKYSF